MMIFAAALGMGFTHLAAGSPISVTAGPIVYLKVIALAPAPTGSKFVAALEDNSVRIIDAKTRSTVRILAKHVGPAYAVAWSPDGTYIASGDETARIYVENALTGEKVREYRTHTKGIQKLSFSMTRQYLASTGKDDQINVYDLSSPSPKEKVRILGKGANFYGACFDPKLPYTISTGILGPGARCYSCVTGQCTGFMSTEDTQGVFDVNYNPNGTREVTAGKDGDAIVWDAKTLKQVGTLKGHTDQVFFAGYSPNGALVATASVDQTVKVWNAYTMQKVADLPAQTNIGSPLCFTADGRDLITVSDQGYLEFNPVSPAQAAVDTPSVVATKATKKKKRRHHA